jgi:glycosyltransferase involved in cell wall biosynthesis
MPRVLIVTHEYTGTGAAVMTQAIVEHWVRRCGWQVDLYRLQAGLALPQALIDAGVGVVERIRPADYALVLAVTVAQPQLLHFVAHKLAPQLPCLLWVHEGDTPLWTTPLTAADWLRLFSAFAHVVFQNAWQRDKVFASFLNPLGPERASIVPNGLPPFDRGAVDPLRAAAGRRRIVFIGGVYPRKRPEDLAVAVETLGRDDIECLFLGPTAHLALCAADLPRLLDSRPADFRAPGELPREASLSYLAGADVFCLPSAQESQPLTLLEAAHLGVPICASALAPYEGIWRHGVNCLLHPVGNTELLAHNLALLLGNERVRQALAAGARQTLRHFDFDRFAAQFTGIAAATMAQAPGR